MSTNEGLNFEVIIEEFAKRYYIKLFKKKYKSAWDVTEVAITQILRRVDNVLGQNNYIKTIKVNCNKLIVKLDFKIAGSNESVKSSGNRAIVFVDNDLRVCSVLLVYSKNEICSPNETAKWQAIIKQNYPEIWKLF